MTVTEITRQTPLTTADCGERFRLRQEYIRCLAEFNQAAANHRLVKRVGMRGPAADASWRTFQEKCAASNGAWARYRKHLATHHCKRGPIEMPSAA